MLYIAQDEAQNGPGLLCGYDIENRFFGLDPTEGGQVGVVR